MENLDIAKATKKREVDQRLPLKVYYRTANNVLRQADVYRAERNVIELYVLLLRFSSLITETIPDHKDYSSPLYKDERSFFRRKTIEILDELEKLKPEVSKIKKNGSFTNYDFYSSSDPNTIPYTWTNNDTHNQLSIYPNHNLPQNRSQNYYANQSQNNSQVFDLLTGDFPFQPSYSSLTNSSLNNSSVANSFSQLRSLSIPRAKTETLQKHSLFQKTNQDSYITSLPKINYPSNVDNSPIVLPDLQPTQEKTSQPDQISWEDKPLQPETLKTISTESKPHDLNPTVNLPYEPIPPPMETEVISVVRKPNNDGLEIQSNAVSTSVIPPSAVADPFPGNPKKEEDGLKKTKSIHISPKMMEEFMRLVKSNTKRNLETCGVLAGILKKGMFFVTTLILPKQEATSDSCSTLNEEEIFETQDSKGLFQLGWIHTHPSQSCFMSSIDLHTHYSYQVMLPEAIAIVMAPSDASRKFGIFHLSDPGGLKVLQKCDKRGFHSHESPPDGGVIYEHCSHVLLNEGLKCEFIDLR